MGYFLLLTTFLALVSQIVSKSSGPDYTTLVYKGCSRNPLSDPNGAYTQSLTSLFSSLQQQASRSKFYKVTTSGQATIAGLYQCRGDLSNADCYNCVSKIPQMIDSLCGKVVAARVQLLGCYMLYEVSGFTQISGMQMLFKMCSPTNVAGSGFEMRRDTALQVMQNGLASGNGFYVTNYQAVYVMGQCEGDLGTTDCAQCAKAAVERAQVECGSSLAGQVYLHKCFISYNYHPNGVSSPFGGGGGGGGGGFSSGQGQNTGKTVAIIVGGTAGVGLLVILVLFIRGLRKKDDDF